MVQKKSSDLYKKYGAIDDWTFEPESLEPKYGCSSFLTEIEVGSDEELFFSLSLFNSKEDHDRIMSLVDTDPEIEDLYKDICDLIDISKIVRGEFNRFV